MKDKDGKEIGAPDNASQADDAARIKELEAENAELKTKLAEVEKKLADIEAETIAAAAKARAEKLVAEWETRGRIFADDAERQAEINKVAAYTDEAYAAVDAVVMNTPKVEAAPAAAAGEQPADPPAAPGAVTDPPPAGTPPANDAAAAGGQPKPKADAGAKPAPVGDAPPPTLESQIAAGMKAHRDAKKAQRA